MKSGFLIGSQPSWNGGRTGMGLAKLGPKKMEPARLSATIERIRLLGARPCGIAVLMPKAYSSRLNNFNERVTHRRSKATGLQLTSSRTCDERSSDRHQSSGFGPSTGADRGVTLGRPDKSALERTAAPRRHRMTWKSGRGRGIIPLVIPFGGRSV